MQAPDQLTCGKGLAENSVLPARMGKLIDAMASNLETHMKALDLTDKDSAADYAAYEGLVKGLQEAALRLQLTAQQMAGYRDLPMGRHDARAMIHPSVREAFENFILRKQELLSLLEQTGERDNQIFETMRTA